MKYSRFYNIFVFLILTSCASTKKIDNNVIKKKHNRNLQPEWINDPYADLDSNNKDLHFTVSLSSKKDLSRTNKNIDYSYVTAKNKLNRNLKGWFNSSLNEILSDPKYKLINNCLNYPASRSAIFLNFLQHVFSKNVLIKDNWYTKKDKKMFVHLYLDIESFRYSLRKYIDYYISKPSFGYLFKSKNRDDEPITQDILYQLSDDLVNYMDQESVKMTAKIN